MNFPYGGPCGCQKIYFIRKKTGLPNGFLEFGAIALPEAFKVEWES